MDAYILFAEHVGGYAAVMFVGLAVIVSEIIDNYRDVLGNITVILAIFAVAYCLRQIVERQRVRSFWMWWVWYPIQRIYHRLIRPARFVARGIMAQWEKRVVADRLHDTLFDMYHKGELSRKKYRKYNQLLAKAMALADLKPAHTGKRRAEDIRENCRVMREQMQNVHPRIPEPTGPVVPEDCSLSFLKNRRNRAA